MNIQKMLSSLFFLACFNTVICMKRHPDRTHKPHKKTKTQKNATQKMATFLNFKAHTSKTGPKSFRDLPCDIQNIIAQKYFLKDGQWWYYHKELNDNHASNAIAFDEDYNLAYEQENKIIIRNIKTNITTSIPTSDDTLFGLTYLDNGKKLAYSSYDKQKIYIIDTQTHQKISS